MKRHKLPDPLTGSPTPIHRLQAVMARLRDRDTGCPWDIQQDFDSIAPYTIEEAYEVADVIQSGERGEKLLDELGDLLFQVIYYAQMSKENGGFDFDDIADHAADKMVRRHPHVFGDETAASNPVSHSLAWEDQKAREREGATGASGADRASARDSATLSGVARALPALIRAEKLTKRAARVGFDWATPARVIPKIEEEITELSVEIDRGAPADRLQDELGDILFAVANLGRKLGIDPEAALRGTNDKFTRRFSAIEAELARRGKTPEQASLREMDEIWNEAKRRDYDRPE